MCKVLDIFGKPNRKFFETLSFFAKAFTSEFFSILLMKFQYRCTK